MASSNPTISGEGSSPQILGEHSPDRLEPIERVDLASGSVQGQGEPCPCGLPVRVFRHDALELTDGLGRSAQGDLDIRVQLDQRQEFVLERDDPAGDEGHPTTPASGVPRHSVRAS